MFELNGKVAVVTGASSGLGRDAAIAYAQAGADVVLLARRLERLEEVAAEIKEIGRDVLAIKMDVTDEENVKAGIQQAYDHFGHLDILLNNAGIAVRGGVDTLTVEDFDKSMDVNVKGIFLVSKYVVKHMMENKYGRIVNVASINAIMADKEDVFIRHSYNASKAAVLGLTKGMAASYGKYNITTNAIGPGLFESEMTEDTLFKSEDFLNLYQGLNPMSRPGKRGELNGTILYFSSDASSYTNGQFIVIDGGMSIV
ncbi:SDR family oxidoreductase [Enterococcus pseudoavium]|uniref:SDR family oxidoreductase n=1 Tax=Enterococcus pseudoavium TaxID=44007 RepID=A0AAE4I1N6_9ENTE|nr:SDR family NAD(P)-dependent oxidoreductase [Enterococcus pseudoavium]MDT2736121.1 SDR family oxidoreductase [Enterococcus pseudoavium]MDT2754093.1 SDR family oxidoreductase [Enterococcus pseudoavium]MDT2770125.1 SDR family oxidoreductase [Enterococcus pseudoavium]REC32773.1 short-chain dehydrogenase [Enterococcus pseudoavium]